MIIKGKKKNFKCVKFKIKHGACLLEDIKKNHIGTFQLSVLF